MIEKDDKFYPETEAELYLAWLGKAYFALGRAGWEDGMTLEELRDNLLNVLSNAGYEPHCTIQGQNLRRVEPVTHLG